MKRGWCPTAHRPMAAGDGLLLRVRPPLGRLTPAQGAALAGVAAVHGNGAIDSTSRAGLQVRGVTAAGWPAALAALVAAGLVDPARDDLPPVVVAPSWTAGDDTHRIATELAGLLPGLPPLPAKVGFAVDTGERAVLGEVPADFRVERAWTGLVLRADGRPTGVAIAAGDAAAGLVELARWFAASGGAEAGRMRRHRTALPTWAEGEVAPLPAAEPRAIPPTLGATHPLPFGRVEAAELAALAAAGTGLRLTPWRRLVVEGVPPAALAPSAARLADVDACVGAPACPQATVATRPLARRLAPLVRDGLHVSGCAKGCARARPAAVVLTGRAGRFDLALDARAGAPPVAAGLDAAAVVAWAEAS